jgi:hypothetical protein
MGRHGALQLALVMLVAAAAGVRRVDIGLDVHPDLLLDPVQLTVELFVVKGSSEGVGAGQHSAGQHNASLHGMGSTEVHLDAANACRCVQVQVQRQVQQRTV